VASAGKSEEKRHLKINGGESGLVKDQHQTRGKAAPGASVAASK